MASDIERRPPQELEIAQFDPLLANLHFSMRLLTESPKARGVWQLSPPESKRTITLRIYPDKITETNVTDKLTIVKEYRHGKTKDLDFFVCRIQVSRGDEVRDPSFAEMSVNKDGVCKFENPNLLRGISFRLHRFREIVDGKNSGAKSVSKGIGVKAA